MPVNRDLLYREIQQANFETQPKKGTTDEWLDSLPLIICGPILRKVQYNCVSVWLAFKEEVTDIELYVYEAKDTKKIGPKTLRLTGTIKSPLKLGKNLFVTLITAESTTQKLVSDVIYEYDIFFTHKGVKKQLGYKGVLKDGKRSICYSSYNYPTFCLPSDTINNLKIVHGSCRKPHGGRTDALRALDTMLELNCTDSKQRPQLLCLTGDQIYADDVSDPLLYTIMNVKDRLFGWKETLPKQPADNQLFPGHRKDLINKNTDKVAEDDLTTEDSKSHLIFFSEFIMMYLFTFSDTFLKASEWPAFEDLYKIPSDKEEKETKLINYHKEIAYLNAFINSLSSVKKALANVSTLMIFDDHEITDDWFITKEWSEAALLKNTISRRYILNGLLAYCVFQDWGNNYLKYASGDGLKILEALKLNYTQNYPNTSTAALEEILLPKLIRDTQVAEKSSYYLKGNFKWNYRIDYTNFTLFVLNTRTERQYYDKEKPVGNLIRQIDFDGNYDRDKLAVIVSAVPVFGVINMETGQEDMRKGNTDVVTAIAARYKGGMNMYKYDQEAWSFSSIGFTKLLHFLSHFKKVLVLSGDVHYGFSAYIKLWLQLGKAYQLSEIFQSTSSALKNSTEETHYPATNKFPYRLEPKANTPYKRIKVLGIKKPREDYKEDDNPVFKDPQAYNPNRTRISLESIKADSSLQYTVKYIKSREQDYNSPLFEKIKRSAQSKRFTNTGKDSPVPHTVVGKDNLSLISFTSNSIVNTIWFANGNFEKPDNSESYRLLFPFVKHVAEFTGHSDGEELPIKEFDKIKESMKYK